MSVLKTFRDRHREGKKSIAVLVDPDKVEDASRLLQLTNLAAENCVDFFFVGGSLITTSNLGQVVKQIKENVTIPVSCFRATHAGRAYSRCVVFFILDIRKKSGIIHRATCCCRPHYQKYQT